MNELIVVDPSIQFGRPTVRGSRIAVSDALSWLGKGMSNQDIVADYPKLSVEKIRACKTLNLKNLSSPNSQLDNGKSVYMYFVYSLFTVASICSTVMVRRLPICVWVLILGLCCFIILLAVDFDLEKNNRCLLMYASMSLSFVSWMKIYTVISQRKNRFSPFQAISGWFSLPTWALLAGLIQCYFCVQFYLHPIEMPRL